MIRDKFCATTVTKLCLRVIRRPHTLSSMLHFGRRLIALTTATLFVLSMAGHGVMMAEAAAKAASDMTNMASQSQSSDCQQGCGGDDGMQMACFAQCASSMGILSDSIEVPVMAAVRHVAYPPAQPLAGRARPPDPHPPKRLAIV